MAKLLLGKEVTDALNTNLQGRRHYRVRCRRADEAHCGSC